MVPIGIADKHGDALGFRVGGDGDYCAYRPVEENR